jgi:cell division protein FtsZ
LITIPNEKLLEVMGKDASLQDAFAMANNVLRNAVQGISELITSPGLINVDFADVKTVMSEMGQAMMGSASASGATRATEAARNALSSPLLEDISIRGARGILVNVTAGPDLTIGEFGEVGMIIREMASEDSTVVIGTSIDPNMKDMLRVTMVATGIQEASAESAARPYTVVKSVARAAGSTYEALPVEELHPEQPSLVKSRRNSELQNLPLYDSDGTSKLDVPTFLRRQAD